MTPNSIQLEAMTGDDVNHDFLVAAKYAADAAATNIAFPVHDPTMSNSSINNNNISNLNLVTAMAPVVPLPTFAATVIPMNPVPNVIQPAMMQQIPAPQQMLNTVQPIAIQSIPIQLQAEAAMQQNLLMQQQQQQQQQQQIQQFQQQQQVQQQLQQVQQELQQQQLQQQQQQQQQVFPGVTMPQQIPAASQPVIHNLIPEHLQNSSFAATSMDGTTGYAPAVILPNNNYVNAVNMMLLAAASSANNPVAVAATTARINPSLIPQQLQLNPQPPQQPIVSIPLTVQDRPSIIPPVFNGINMAYPGVETLGVDPPLFLVRDFLTHAECDFLIRAADGVWQPAPVVGKGAGEISPSRTSSTCFLARQDLPDYMAKVSALTSKPIDHCELPQVGRYLPSQQYRHHFDAFDLGNEDGRRFAQNGGQRVVTVLVYLNDCAQGGQTDFPAMNLQVSPRKGTAVVFFPATVDGYLDKRALHAALPAIDTKYVSQVWIRQGPYTGAPSKRLAQPMVNVLY